MDHIERKQMRPSRAATNRKSGYLSEMLLPTPTAQLAPMQPGLHSWNGKYFLKPDGRKHQTDLQLAVLKLPTPRSTDGAKGGPNQRGSKGDMALPMAVLHIDPTGAAGPMRLNPSFVEAMMGYPPGWTEIN
jgi:hypothetical protein